ncbi:WASH complex subunit 2 isoform X2 [Brienomyrus brachyistius]|uniref:WASH complex subunit 2 isoform X2 n=1 Tax=Brienomyrus brachyistius TaxID=42636 RepID=UPI0020B2B643|nr:WASH complex subunit 2 isoform X2 [Brienomyrus brachyistius]
MSAQTVTLSNGPSEQVWERPWSLDEMRKTSANWSLAADSGLFLFLQDFSQRMLSKTHQIEKQLDGLLRDTKATDSCLHTVFNDFLMLSNTQFIENRVYDEEVEEPVAKPEAPEKHPEQEKTREQKEAELIPKVQEAVNYGLKVLESAFEQLDIKAGNSDSEDEEAIGRVEPILEPKDLYLDRPLPYLIGSQLFMEQDDVGLGDLSSEEMSIDSDRDSVIDSDEDKDEDKSPVLSDEDEVRDEDEADEDSDIFGESDKDDEDRKTSVAPSSFTDELTARIKGDDAGGPKSDGNGSVVPSVKRRSKGDTDTKAAENTDELFPPPSREDRDHSPFGGKDGLFSGGRGLFDVDDEDEGDLFSEGPGHQHKLPTNEAAAGEESVLPKSSKKIPAGAVSIFPEHSLFGATRDPVSSERQQTASPSRPKAQAQLRSEGGVKAAPGGGLFDDDEDDDFFSGSAFKKSHSAGMDKPRQKKVVDLFGADQDDDEEGDIFSESSSAGRREHKSSAEEDGVTSIPEKKLPAGATSMFGPETSNLLQDALKKRPPVSDKSTKKMTPPTETAKPTVKTTDRGLFSDDEDTQIFSSAAKDRPKSDGPAQKTQSRALSLFDDEEEEDLFATVPPKLKTSPGKNEASQKAAKPLSSALFSDDEDQWMSNTTDSVKQETKTGGLKSSVSAPSRLPTVKATGKASLFDDDEDDDLFAATKESGQKPPRVSLLFEEEDEEDEDKGSLFSVTPASSSTVHSEKNAPATADSQAEVPPPLQAKEEPDGAHQGEDKAKSAGAVSLFDSVEALGETQAVLKVAGQPESPPLMGAGSKTKKKVLSLFEDEEEDEEETDGGSATKVRKPGMKSPLKVQERRPRATSTGVFQDEEILFSLKLQKDNEPDVDLFAASAKHASPKARSAPKAAPPLFGDEEEDLFTVPRAAAQKPVKLSSEGALPPPAGLQVNLAIDPSTLLPGAVPRPQLPSQTRSIHSPTTPTALGTDSTLQTVGEGAVSFDTPVQVTTLQSANKGRARGAERRRPQTRAARLQAAQISDSSSNPTLAPLSLPPALHTASRPSKPALPGPAHRERVPEQATTIADDPFGDEDIFVAPKLASKAPVPKPAPKKQPSASIFQERGNDQEDDLFRAVSAKPAKKSSTVAFLEDEEEEDIFAAGKSTKVDVEKEAKMQPNPPQPAAVQDPGRKKSAPQQEKEHALDVSLFGDEVDIFADLTATSAPKEKKSKKKLGKKSIFDDDMDDIFASGPVKPVAKETKSKRSPQSQEPQPSQNPSHSLFDDPLNALGGN